MAHVIYKSKYKKNRHWRFFLSSDWASFTPWKDERGTIPYFAKRTEYSETGKVRFDMLYIGPFAILYACYTL